jgi:hypothetical protein
MPRLKHGQSAGGGTGEYWAWVDMRQRVLSPNHAAFPEFGGRGITLNPRWLSFSNFFVDMGTRPPGAWLGRLDHNGEYGPRNVRWMSPKESVARRRPRRKPEAQAA